MKDEKDKKDKKHKSLEKVFYAGRLRCIYVGPHGGRYVRVDGTFRRLVAKGLSSQRGGSIGNDVLVVIPPSDALKRIRTFLENRENWRAQPHATLSTTTPGPNGDYTFEFRLPTGMTLKGNVGFGGSKNDMVASLPMGSAGPYSTQQLFLKLFSGTAPAYEIGDSFALSLVNFAAPNFAPIADVLPVDWYRERHVSDPSWEPNEIEATAILFKRAPDTLDKVMNADDSPMTNKLSLALQMFISLYVARAYSGVLLEDRNPDNLMVTAAPPGVTHVVYTLDGMHELTVPAIEFEGSFLHLCHIDYGITSSAYFYEHRDRFIIEAIEYYHAHMQGTDTVTRRKFPSDTWCNLFDSMDVDQQLEDFMGILDSVEHAFDAISLDDEQNDIFKVIAELRAIIKLAPSSAAQQPTYKFQAIMDTDISLNDVGRAEVGLVHNQARMIGRLPDRVTLGYLKQLRDQLDNHAWHLKDPEYDAYSKILEEYEAGAAVLETTTRTAETKRATQHQLQTQGHAPFHREWFAQIVKRLLGEYDDAAVSAPSKYADAFRNVDVSMNANYRAHISESDCRRMQPMRNRQY